MFPQYFGRDDNRPASDRTTPARFAAKKPVEPRAEPLILAEYTGRQPEGSQEDQTPPTRKINVRGLLMMGGLLLVALLSLIPIKLYSDQTIRRSALAQARSAAKQGDLDRAFRHLEEFLESWPEDLEALEEAARIRSESAWSFEQLNQAADLNYRLLRLDPYGEDRQDTRRRLVQLWIRLSATWRAAAADQKFGMAAANESKYRAAQLVARELAYGVKVDGKVVVAGVNTGQSHRLLAQTLDAQVLSGDAKYQEYLAEAIREFRTALRLDPEDSISAERLVQHELDKKKNPGAAQKLMEDLLAANPKSTDIRVVRYRYFLKIQKFGEATAELDAAVALAPDSIDLRFLAAQDALRRHDLAAVETHCNAVPATAKEAPRFRMIVGMLEFSRGNQEKAIEHFRKGLVLARGQDLDLTFYLARSLISLNRLSDARPLIAQFQRLEGNDQTGISRFLNALYEQKSGHFSRAIADLKYAEPRVPEAMRGELQLALGQCYQSLGELAQAKAAFRSAIALMPSAAEPRREIARSLLSTNPQEALAEMDRVLAKSPRDLSLLHDAGRLHLARQRSLPVADRNWGRVEELLGQADKIAPGEYIFRTLRSEYLIARGNPDAAIDLMSRAVDGPERKNLDAWIFLASRLLELGRRDDAVRVLEDAGRPDAVGDHARIRVARATILARAGKGQQARDLLTRDRDRLPDSEQPELSRALGDLAREMGDRDTARAAYVDWARLVPDSTEPGLALMGLGAVFGDQEASRLGIEALRAIGGDREPYGMAAQALDLLREDPDHPGPASAEKIDEAERLLGELSAIAPQLMVGHLIRGSLLERQGKLPEAAIEFRQALEDGGSTLALVGLVKVLWALRKFEEINLLQKKYEFQTTQSGSKELAVGFYQIAIRLAQKEGDAERARYFAAKIVEQLPDSVDARSNLARLLDSLGKPKEAEATFRELIKRHPNDASAWVALASFQSLRGKPGDLARTIEEISKTYKGERIELLMGRCHWLARDIPAAIADYATALKKGPDDPLTLREVADFDRANNRLEELDAVLRKASKLNLPWASQSLALRLSSSQEPSSWAEAWSLVKPGATTSNDSPADRLLQATILARSPDPARRDEAYSAMIALVNDLPASNPVAVEARVRLAQALLDTNRPDEAESYIAAVADSLSRPNPTALAISIEALARSGQVEKASARLERLVAIEPKSPRTSSSKAWVLHARGNQSEAITTIEEAIDQTLASPEGEVVAVALVGVALKLGNDDGLEQLLAKVAARWPRQAILMARFLADRKRYTDALESARTALAAGSVGESIQVATDMIIACQSDPNSLKQIYALGDYARSKYPKVLEVLLFQAILRHIEKLYDQEVAFYREASVLNPHAYFFLNNMAWTLSEGLGKGEEALARIDEAIRGLGRQPQLLDTRGVILARLGRYNDAIAELEQSARDRPSATTYFHLARIYLKTGKPEEFRRFRDLARKANLNPAELDPTDREYIDEILVKRL